MKREDWLLLTIATAEGDGLDPVQLQKSLFLLGQKRKRDVGSKFYKFAPHNYGPFSKEVYADADALARQGLISKTLQPGYSWSVFRITDAGESVAVALRREAPQNGLDYLDAVVRWARSLRFDELIRSIYKHFPDYSVNSVFRE